MAERQIPGGPFLNETTDDQAQIPGGPLVNQTAGGSEAYNLAADAFSITAAVQDASLDFVPDGINYNLDAEAFAVAFDVAPAARDVEMAAAALSMAAAFSEVTFALNQAFELEAEGFLVSAAFPAQLLTYSGEVAETGRRNRASGARYGFGGRSRRYH